ncbi:MULTISPECIES: phage tail protein [Streptomyces]|uniref:phage tail protein n=1 Tax=Streptomyces TaxID=1883 RepID=UPI0001D0621A|nr:MULTISPECIES: phage tail protein [Streptomyces]MYS40369.1 phage tail protein [Streptomyces sp. SID5998]MYX42220.1 phage tail protein [Streptomyces sp. SID89]EFF93370.1 secreted protein [Streptomyces sp. e14]MBY8867640.1 phage tail protein [Streptomyces sennicomposti]MYX31541.1 phage tail protein [Streptomyces sp. SID8381]
MRGSIDGLGSSAPIGMMLPAVFADDDLAQRFVGGLDEVMAPILSVLDCLDTYFRPSVAPLDFVRWLGGWVGAETEGGEPEPLLRAAVAAAAYLHRIRGTRRGLSETVRLAFGVAPEISESGAADWSARPLGPVPGERRPRLHVHLRLPHPTTADRHRLDTLVAAARPAHMPYTVQVTATEAAVPAERTSER